MAFFVRSAESGHCPCCAMPLAVVGSRPRVWYQSSGDKAKLIIRRLYCEDCKKIHHELPNILVPYKRYDAQSIETVVSDLIHIDVAADESTIARWRSWFLVWVLYAEGCLQSFSIRFGQIVRELSSPSQSALHPLGHFVGNAAGWLSRAVRPIINVNLWITDPFCIHDRDLLG